MNIVQPQSFSEFTGGLLLLPAVAFAFISLMPALRRSSLRLSAISFLAALALFSSYWVTYFAAIFIIATAVTELEFLHVLAAIIRGDKNYFDFRREFLTHEEVLRKARQDEVPDSSATKSNDLTKAATDSHATISPLTNGPPAQTAFRIEERALEWFEKEFSLPVQRYVRFRNDKQVAEFDGVVQGAKQGEPDTLIEVKWVRKEPPGSGTYGRIVDQASRLGQKYKEITKRDAELILLLVVPQKLPQAVATQMTERLFVAA